MGDFLTNALVSLGTEGAQTLLISAAECMIKKYKEARDWKKLITEAGEFFIKDAQEEMLFFQDLKAALSKENLAKIATDLKEEDGYGLEYKLQESLGQLMRDYDIPCEVAELYTGRIAYAILDQLREINPQKYREYFLHEWRETQEKNLLVLKDRLDKISNELEAYKREQLAIVSLGEMDITLRRNTSGPSIGIDFFLVDDEKFRADFNGIRDEELVFIRGRNREEAIYCVLNELWRLKDMRPVYVVKSLASWRRLQTMKSKGNVYIPWFYADEIAAIPENTNIFVINENMPDFGKKVLALRPRTRATIANCLREAGLAYDKVDRLLADTHGLYSQMKKKLFKGECLRRPDWMTGMSENAKKTCLLLSCWEEIEGDKLIVESLYEDTYDKFIEEILPYTKGEDPLLHMVRHNGRVFYYLASTENTWSYLDVLLNEKIWKAFVYYVVQVVNESEPLFIYNTQERLLADLKGERLFWSATIRKGMLNTLIYKGTRQNQQGVQVCLDKIVAAILTNVTTEKQWSYLATFWPELCEISPTVVIDRLEREWQEDTGLRALFQNQSNDVFFERNPYISILWGVEQLLTQKEFFWPAFRWLLKLDAQQYAYHSNSPKDTFMKIFCTWRHFSPLQTAAEKIKAAEIAFEIDFGNAWEYLYSAVADKRLVILGELSYPRYRDHYISQTATFAEMRETDSGYYKMLMKYMVFSVNRWRKILEWSGNLAQDIRREIFKQLLDDRQQMSDEEVMKIKNEVRYIIGRHRYFASADWAMSEETLAEYERLLESLTVQKPEYEYVYLFSSDARYLSLSPNAYGLEDNYEKNQEALTVLIKEKISEFQRKHYDLAVLARACAEDPYSTLGGYLARLWKDGKWERAVFELLLRVQGAEKIALDYLQGFDGADVEYASLIKSLSQQGCSGELLTEVYRIEACYAKGTPLITNAPPQRKKDFWKTTIYLNGKHEEWALAESKKYAPLPVYLDQLYQRHYRKKLTAEMLLDCLDGIETMPCTGADQMTSYYATSLIAVLQEAYIEDSAKSLQIAKLEIFFMNLLEGGKMKCFHRMIKQTPELWAQIVATVFKRDHAPVDEVPPDQRCVSNMYTLYKKVRFCPAEDCEKIDEAQLEQWVKKYQELLQANDQESLFTATLGRLFSFSPVGADGHEPCEAVRKMIEKYGDDNMINSYRTSVYNRRGIYSPSAGRMELKMAEAFKANSQYLAPDYPKTAKIFWGLYDIYKEESDRERLDAENGWY